MFVETAGGQSERASWNEKSYLFMCLFIYFLCHCQSRRRVGHGGRWPLGKGGRAGGSRFVSKDAWVNAAEPGLPRVWARTTRRIGKQQSVEENVLSVVGCMSSVNVLTGTAQPEGCRSVVLWGSLSKTESQCCYDFSHLFLLSAVQSATQVRKAPARMKQQQMALSPGPHV